MWLCLSQVAFNLRLARYYMWAQTDYMVYVAVHVPTGTFKQSLLMHEPRV